MAAPLAVHPTPIPGLVVVDLDLRGDDRGWFKENWQAAKMVALGLPDIKPVQNNISFNDAVGVTRGLHAEPWDKFVALATGRIFGAWCDVRRGPSFGTTFTIELGPDQAVFVPRGVANGYQTLAENTAYTYLVNAHWSPSARYTFVNLADPTVGIEWPIPLERAIVSDKDRGHPALADVVGFEPRGVAILGAGGQLANALLAAYATAGVAAREVRVDDLDLTDEAALAAFDWDSYEVVVNAAAYTAVDGAETPDGRRAAWRINAEAPGRLARLADQHDFTLVHVSSDYVFDGTADPHPEAEPVSPLGVYGQTKAAGDLAVLTARRSYVCRTSWLIGDGTNFVKTMAALAAKGVRPAVVADQRGRLTFTTDLAAAILHLVAARAPYGVYNVSNSGATASWAQIARSVFELVGADPSAVSDVTTEEYFADHPEAAPRPLNSTLDLTKLTATGFAPRPWEEALAAYVASLEAVTDHPARRG